MVWQKLQKLWSVDEKDEFKGSQFIFHVLPIVLSTGFTIQPLISQFSVVWPPAVAKRSEGFATGPDFIAIPRFGQTSCIMDACCVLKNSIGIHIFVDAID